MGSKKKFISRMEKCNDWVIWCKPKDARILRLNGVKNPLGFWNVEGHMNQNMYILNGEHSFSYWSTMSGSYQTGSFHSEDYVLKKAVKKFRNDNYTLQDHLRTVLDYTTYENDELRACAMKADGFAVHAYACYASKSHVYLPPLFLWGGEKVQFEDKVGKLIPTPHTKHYFTQWADVKVELEDNTIIQVKANEIKRL